MVSDKRKDITGNNRDIRYPLPRVHRGMLQLLLHPHTHLYCSSVNLSLHIHTSHILIGQYPFYISCESKTPTRRDVQPHPNLLRPHPHPPIPRPVPRFFLCDTGLFNRSITFNTPRIPFPRGLWTRKTSVPSDSSPTGPYACFITRRSTRCLEGLFEGKE